MFSFYKCRLLKEAFSGHPSLKSQHFLSLEIHEILPSLVPCYPPSLTCDLYLIHLTYILLLSEYLLSSLECNVYKGGDIIPHCLLDRQHGLESTI